MMARVAVVSTRILTCFGPLDVAKPCHQEPQTDALIQVIVIGFVLFLLSKVDFTGTKSVDLGNQLDLDNYSTGLLLITLFAIGTYFSLNNFL